MFLVFSCLVFFSGTKRYLKVIIFFPEKRGIAYNGSLSHNCLIFHKYSLENLSLGSSVVKLEIQCLFRVSIIVHPRIDYSAYDASNESK